MFKFWRDWKRKKLAGKPFPPEWEEILEEEVPYYDELEGEELENFKDHLKVFVWQKHWVGAGDFEVTDEKKVLTAAVAARIARQLPLEIYDRVSEIVLYPSHYKHPDDHHSIVYGEANDWGTIVLSWDAVEKGVAVTNDGKNTAIHEFAHAIDFEDGSFDGTPVLEEGEDYEPWSRILGRYFHELQEDPESGVVRAYGAINEAEFFAVATETFFEKPRKLKRDAPDLYDELAGFYGVDPANSKKSRK